MNDETVGSTPLLGDSYEAFLLAPTSQNQQKLMQAATAYRESWIEARASAAVLPAVPEADKEAATRYKRVVSVRRQQPDGTEIDLALQSRTSRLVGRTWFVVSWRTRLSPGGHNRRFYLTDGRPWSMQADTALAMLEALGAKGGLEARYEDNDRAPGFTVRDSALIDAAKDPALLAEVTMEREDWGPKSKLMVLADPNANWRKVMIVRPDLNEVTFRSTTTDTTYRPRAELRPGSEWFLDNSMQDINVQQARAVLDALRKALK